MGLNYEENNHVSKLKQSTTDHNLKRYASTD